ncbi:MAG: hypothetical protein ACRCXC_02240 [Legionella sp.]
MIIESDYKRSSMDTERTSYAIIHILVSTVLLALAVAEAVFLQSASLEVSFWTIAAEVGSVGVGIGQLRYYADSEVKNTLFAEYLGVLAKANRNKSEASDWDQIQDNTQRRKELRDDLYHKTFQKNDDVRD